MLPAIIGIEKAAEVRARLLGTEEDFKKPGIHERLWEYVSLKLKNLQVFDRS
jgi:hypothetical protein